MISDMSNNKCSLLLILVTYGIFLCGVQSLMTGLMFNRPEDHITYLRNCLEELDQESTDEPVAWNRFIAGSKPLPPISTSDQNGYHSSPRHQQDASAASARCKYFVVTK